MIARQLALFGWIVLGLEAVFIAFLFLSRNVGDDAAGRGLATGFGIILAPIVIGAGALMYWGQRGGPIPAFYLGLFIVSTPLIWGTWNVVTGGVTKVDRAIGRAQYGKFENAKLTKLARAVDKGDSAKVAELLGAGPVDFEARDRRGRTILGHAITQSLGMYSGAGHVDAIRQLLAAGAKPLDNVIGVEATPAEPEADKLLISVVGGAGDIAHQVLELVLAAGLSPNGVDMDGRPVLFSTYLDLVELQILTRHGADLNVKDPRTDRLGYTTLINAIEMGEWQMASFYVEHGVDTDHVTADGTSVASLLDKLEDSDSAVELRKLIAARKAAASK